MDILNYINDKFQASISGSWIENIEPATGEILGMIPDCNEQDLELAVGAAKAAFPYWSSLDTSERANYLNKIADIIERDIEKFALAESMDSGKPIKLAMKVDIPRAIQNFRFFAAIAQAHHDESFNMGKLGFNYTQKSPIGVVGLISPWNLPIYLLSWKIAPALAVGNTVIAKPSEITPSTAYLLSQAAKEAGLPAGVLNIVHGKGSQIGELIVSHPEIKAISFTGGTETGKKIATIAAPMFKKLSLELGGKNAAIVMDDCNFEYTIKELVKASFTNQGQICLCSSRILVRRSIFPWFVEAFIEEVKKLRIGDPMDGNTQFGAVTSQAQLDKILKYVDIAVANGGRILTGGKIYENVNERCKNGYFFEPTVIVGLEQNCSVIQDEIFGPVVTIQPIETEEEGIQFANDVKYGLSASIWTENINRAHRLANQLHVGIVWINSWLVRDLRTPFGGMKDSGVGREGGNDALNFFTEPKNIFVRVHSDHFK